jgi:ATP-dependent RNA helicase DDX52/ROK1
MLSILLTCRCSYDFPQSATSYVHRIGRTARHNRPGTAITLFTQDDGPHLRTIVNVMRSSGLTVPDWMLLKKPSKEDKKKLKRRPVERLEVSQATGYQLAQKGKRKRRSEKVGGEAGKTRRKKKAKVDLQEA